jgi:integrase
MAQRKRTKVIVVKYKNRPFGIRWTNSVGKTREESTGVRNRREAERIAAAKEIELEKFDPDSKMIAWSAFRERYENEELSRLSDATWGIWTTSANRLETDMNPDRLADVTKSLLSRWLMLMRDAGLADMSQRTYVSHIRSALSWACYVDLLDFVPKLRLPRLISRKMRSRGVTEVEFTSILNAVPTIRPNDSDRWVKFLNGLYHSSLRADELRRLSWDADAELSVITTFDYPLIRMLAPGHKARRDEYQPVTPDFWQLIAGDVRYGYVFPLKDKGQLSQKRTIRTISDIGEASGVVTDETTGKTATSHDIGRRAFLSRMDSDLSTAELQKWARHASPQTTMQFYHHKSAIELAKKVWGSDFAKTLQTDFSRHEAS